MGRGKVPGLPGRRSGRLVCWLWPPPRRQRKTLCRTSKNFSGGFSFMRMRPAGHRRLSPHCTLASECLVARAILLARAMESPWFIPLSLSPTVSRSASVMRFPRSHELDDGLIGRSMQGEHMAVYACQHHCLLDRLQSGSRGCHLIVTLWNFSRSLLTI